MWIFSNFYPRPPRGGRQKAPSCCEPGAYISIHALREEGDSHGLACMDGNADFYPRPPRGGRRYRRRSQLIQSGFLSTPSARRATLYAGRQLDQESISIHALREEGDTSAGRITFIKRYFYPRPPRGGRRLNGKTQILPLKFLSTPSARRATSIQGTAHRSHQISIHALREEGDPSARPSAVMERISIHALREEGDALLHDVRRAG